MNETKLLARIKNEIIDDTTIVFNSVAIQILISNILIEDIHFSKQMASFENIGWKAIARNLKE